MKIKYFAWIKDITNKDYDVIDKDFPKNIEELKQLMSKLYPDLEKHLSKNILRYAINMEYVSTNKNLTINDEVAIFPPVSGG
tara:strand:- start:726 stop:971 length:246 start_codon:yes stop_codon:yes gene_type:complete